MPQINEIVLMARPHPLGPLPDRGTLPENVWTWLERCEHLWYYVVARDGNVLTVRFCFSAYAGALGGANRLLWNTVDECRIVMPTDQACFLTPVGDVLAVYNDKRLAHHAYPAVVVREQAQAVSSAGAADWRLTVPLSTGTLLQRGGVVVPPMSPGTSTDLSPHTSSAPHDSSMYAQPSRMMSSSSSSSSRGQSGIPFSEFSAAAIGEKSSALKYTAPDAYGQQLGVDSPDSVTLEHSTVHRLYLAASGLRNLMNGQTSLMSHHLTTDNIMTCAQSVWFETNSVTLPCPALALAVYTLGDADLLRRAVFLRFQRLEGLSPSSLKLEHFLVWPGGRPRVVVTMADLVEALQGVAIWMVFLLGSLWLGMMNGFLADVAANRFFGYPMVYLRPLVCEALFGIWDLPLRERIFPATPSLALRDKVAQRFTDIKTFLDGSKLFEYAIVGGHLGALFPGMATPAATPTRPVAPPPTPSSVVSTVSSSSSSASSVCYGSLCVHYDLPFNRCPDDAPACGGRVHYSKLPAGTTRTGLVTMLQGLREGPLRVSLLDKIAQDPALSV
jgi:hypothetical protein